MATISGLQAPNPYDAQAPRTRVASRSMASPQDTLTHVASASASYSPDWMQADSASQAASPGIYGAKGESIKLPAANPPANEPAKSGARG